MEELNIDDFIHSQVKPHFDFKDFSDSDTYALRDFKTAAQNKLFWHFIENLGIPNDGKAKYILYYYFNGKNKSFTNSSVFYCREKMQPSKWYYNISEALPERIQFTPKHPVEDLQYRETLGIQKLKVLIKDYTLPKFCDIYNLNFLQMKNMIYKRINSVTGKECYKILPPEKVVKNLKTVINPDMWYIFTDEV